MRTITLSEFLKLHNMAGKPDAGSKCESVPAGNSHEIKIDADFKVTVDDRPFKREQNRRSLIGFAYFAKGSETFKINTRMFLELIEGKDRDWSNRWWERRTALELAEEKGKKAKTFQFFNAEMIAEGEYRITGLRFIHELTSNQFETYFKMNPFQNRKRDKKNCQRSPANAEDLDSANLPKSASPK